MYLTLQTGTGGYTSTAAPTRRERAVAAEEPMDRMGLAWTGRNAAR